MFGTEISMGEAGIITLFSMGIVFAVLFAISLILDLFKMIFTKSKNDNKLPEVKVVPQPIISTAPKEDEEELIAVITAAIAAHLGKNSDGLIVRSIVQVRNQEPAWANAGRTELMK
jgi:glutaconyl-CoA/methylmalonyl-CoA decarboxylase subunit delta